MDPKFLRLPAVLNRYGIARSTLYQRIAEGAFIKPIHIGRSSLWSVRELDNFDEARALERGAPETYSSRNGDTIITNVTGKVNCS